MTCLMLLMRLFVFLTMTSVGKQESEIYRDLCLSSIDSVAALNEAVANFVLQLAELRTSLSEVKRNQELTKKALVSLEQKFNHLEQERLSVIDERVTDLTTSLAVTNAKIDDAMDEVLIVSGEQAAGNEKCMKVCAGSTGRTTTDWVNYYGEGIYYDVDISDCGFQTIPTVTTSVEGSSNHWSSLGTSSIYNTSPSTFRIYLFDARDDPIKLGEAEQLKWNVEWIAVGYTC